MDGLNKSYRKRHLAEPHALSHEVSAFIYILINHVQNIISHMKNTISTHGSVTHQIRRLVTSWTQFWSIQVHFALFDLVG